MFPSYKDENWHWVCEDKATVHVEFPPPMVGRCHFSMIYNTMDYGGQDLVLALAAWMRSDILGMDNQTTFLPSNR